MKPTLISALISIPLLFSCSESENQSTVPVSSSSIPEVEQTSEIEEELNQLEALPINEDNKILYDALVPLGSNIQPKEMNLAEDGFRILPRSIIGNLSGVDYTLYADFSIDINDQHAVIIRVKTQKNEGTEPFQETETNYLISFDEQWRISDRQKIHSKNSAISDMIVSSEWNKINEGDNFTKLETKISWKKINLQNGKVIITDEGSQSFEENEDGTMEAKQFDSTLHTETDTREK